MGQPVGVGLRAVPTGNQWFLCALIDSILVTFFMTGRKQLRRERERRNQATVSPARNDADASNEE
jgi:hypothetical protein